LENMRGHSRIKKLLGASFFFGLRIGQGRA
jgi:hypothetical protein